MPHRSSRAWTLALAALAGVFLFAPQACAQQAAAATPAQTPEASLQGAPPEQPPPGPIGGVEQYRLEGAGLGRSYYIPRLTLQELYNSNPGISQTSGSAQADSVTTITGGITLQLLQRNSSFSLDVSSEGIIYNTGTVPNGAVQQLAATEKLTLRRWGLLFSENLSYLPSSSFSLGGLGLSGGSSAGLSGVGGTGNLNSSLQPGQSIASPGVNQLSSSSAFQAQYDLKGGSSLSGSVVAGFLHFFGSSLLNSRNLYGRFGYDKAVTRRDTLNFSFVVSNFSYASSANPGFTSYAFQAGYRRFVSHRLHAFVTAGPMITHFSPAPGQAAVPGGSNLVNWSLTSGLDYSTRRGGGSIQYSHGVSGGSGFFVGTLSDQVTASLNRQFSRNWTGSINGGFAHNSSLQQTSPGTTGRTNQVFNNWFGGVTVSHTLGRYSSLSFLYNANRQTSNTTACAMSLACGPVYLTQVAGVTLNWSTRPLKVE